MNKTIENRCKNRCRKNKNNRQKSLKNDVTMAPKLLSISGFSRFGGFAKMCTTLGRELDFKDLSVQKVEATIPAKHAKSMLEQIMENHEK